MKKFILPQKLVLEIGAVLNQVEIGYHTFGKLNDKKDNCIWVFHALTANSNPTEWWEELVGEGRVLDPGKYFIVCANMLGSCYGSTNPDSIQPISGNPYGRDFPLITIRDMVKAHKALKTELGISKIKLGIGGSMGGQQLLEWSISEPDLFERICLLATNAKHSAWGRAFNEAQRMALEADSTLYDSKNPKAGKFGIEAARAVAMLSYRNYTAYQITQSENEEKLENYKAASYQRYQGLKLSRRFSPRSYISLGKSMDSHDVGRDRGGVTAALSLIKAKTLVIGISSDVLFPPSEQILLANQIPNSRLEIIDSDYGHDGFLVEGKKIAQLLHGFLIKTDSRIVQFDFNSKNKTGKVKALTMTSIPGSEPF
jgi:homoserine O-acetyltransferase